MKQGELMLV